MLNAGYVEKGGVHKAPKVPKQQIRPPAQRPKIGITRAGKEIIRIWSDGSFKVSEDVTLRELQEALNKYLSSKDKSFKIDGVETVMGSMHMFRTNYADN